MNKKQVIVDMNNPYVKALIKSFETFMLEECDGFLSTEERLIISIKKARILFESERMELIQKSALPAFEAITTTRYQLIFNKRD